MGRIENKTFNNIFITPSSGNGTLEVYLQSRLLNQDLFRLEMKKNNILNAIIFMVDLDEKDFFNLINKIKACTTKEVFLAVTGDIDYLPYIEKYRTKYEHFPDNVFINHTVVDYDQHNNLVIKKSL